MSEERFDRLEQQLREQAKQVDDGFQRIDKRFEQIDRRFEQIDRRFEQIDRRFEQVDKQFVDLRNHMGVLHEELVDRIKAIGAPAAPAQAESVEWNDSVKRTVESHEAMAIVVRQHEDTLRRHESEIEALKSRPR